MPRLADRVALIAWPAANWETMERLMQADVLPNVQRLVSEGVSGILSPLPPQPGPALYTSLVTGVRADRHGIVTTKECDPRTGRLRAPLSSSCLKPALWHLLSDAGARSLVVGWPSQYPCQPIRGVSVCTEFVDAVLPLNLRWSEPPGSVYPESAVPDLTALCLPPTELTSAEIAAFIPDVRVLLQKHDQGVGILARRLARNIGIHAVTTSLMRREPWQLLTVCYGLIESALIELQQNKSCNSRKTSETAYLTCDIMLGRLLELAGHDTLIVLASAFGVAPDNSTLRESPGFVVMHGPRIRCNHAIQSPTVLDIAPTVLYALGFPIPTDMEGAPLTAAFLDSPTPEFSTQHPPASDARGEDVEAERSIRQLEELGYADPTAEAIARNSAQVRRERVMNLALLSFSSADVYHAMRALEEFQCPVPYLDRAQ